MLFLGIPQLAIFFCICPYAHMGIFSQIFPYGHMSICKKILPNPVIKKLLKNRPKTARKTTQTRPNLYKKRAQGGSKVVYNRYKRTRCFSYLIVSLCLQKEFWVHLQNHNPTSQNTQFLLCHKNHASGASWLSLKCFDKPNEMITNESALAVGHRQPGNLGGRILLFWRNLQ